MKKLMPLLAAFWVTVSLPSFTQSAVFTYPGPDPCSTTLQACIDGAGVGDTVQIGTNSPINESPSLTKSLVLRAAAGFAPVLSQNHTITATSSGVTNNTFTIQGFTLQRGIINVVHSSTGVLTVYIEGNTILESFTTNPAITVRAGNVSPPVMGDMDFKILNNEITVPTSGFSETEGISIQSGNNPAATGVIKGNTIVMKGNSQGAAIDLANGDNTLVVDVIGNIISGSNYDDGIFLFQFSPGGSTTARIINNLVTGQNGNTGNPAAVAIDGDQGTLNVLVVNNTIVNNRRGVSITGRQDLGGVIHGDVANNIIVYNSQSGLVIDPDFASTVTNSFNLLYKNHFDMSPLGAGTLKKNPKFIGTDDYRLQSGSPAVNKGSNVKVPVDVTTDLNGNPRIVSGTVDMGAFEFQNQVDLSGDWSSLLQSCRSTAGGEKCSLLGKFDIENLGDSDAPSSHVKFYLSGDAIYNAGTDAFLKQISTGTVKAGKIKTLRFGYNLTTGGNATGKYVIGVIDPDGTIPESSEDNNIVVFGPIP
jgi:hypothetical protein